MKRSGAARGPQILKTMALPLFVVALNILIILFPKQCMAAAREGLSLWFQNVLPSLLPFIIGTNLMTSLGVVHFLGVLLEPVMRPIFGVPGCGGYGLAVGLLSGYPMGAKVTAQLCEREDIKHTEGQRLLAFANNSGPLFVLGAVASGMFGSPAAGYFLLTVHYLGALLIGLLFRSFGRKAEPPAPPRPISPGSGSIWRKAYRSLLAAKHRDTRSLGAKLGDSVVRAMETILMIGGFIILFCVLVHILELLNVFTALSFLLEPVFRLLHIPAGLLPGLLTGAIEMTNGLHVLSQSGANKGTLVAAATIISWGGFSIHAQALSFLGKTELKAGFYLLAKLLHSILSAILGWALFPLFSGLISRGEAVPAFAAMGPGVWSKMAYAVSYYTIMMLGILLLGIVILVAGRILTMRRLRRYDKRGWR